MKLFHNIEVNIFIKPEEDYDSLKKGFIGLFPFDLTKERVKINEMSASTFHDRKIKIVEVRLTKDRHMIELFDDVKEKLSEADKKMLVKQIDSRIDDELCFFFRLSRKKLIEDNKYVVVDHGDCYHFKCHIATYPRNKEKAKGMIKEFIE